MTVKSVLDTLERDKLFVELLAAGGAAKNQNDLGAF
jgi:hypothetical protein